MTRRRRQRVRRARNWIRRTLAWNADAMTPAGALLARREMGARARPQGPHDDRYRGAYGRTERRKRWEGRAT